MAREFRATEHAETHPTFSPNGKWLAYSSNFSGVDEVYILPVSGQGNPERVSVNTGQAPTWSRDGKELFFRVFQVGYFSVSIREGPNGIEAGSPKRLFDDVYNALGPGRHYDVAPDGRFLFAKNDSEKVKLIIQERFPGKLHLVQNWFTRLEELAPTGK